MVGVKVLLAFVGRPSHASHLRRTWNVAHWWMGRLLLLLGIVLVYDGLLLYRSGRSKPRSPEMLACSVRAHAWGSSFPAERPRQEEALLCIHLT